MKQLLTRNQYLASLMISSVQGADLAFSRLSLKLFRERSSLMTFLFHSLFRDRREIGLNQVDPQQQITVADFRDFVDYSLNQGFEFTSPDRIINGSLNAEKKYILITFDDGYFNNRHALPVLQEYHVPAVFFISTGNVIEQKSFWWDVLFREGAKRNLPDKKISALRRELKKKKAAEIERMLEDKFGAKALLPLSEIDRPFTPAELKELCGCEYVSLGNHTRDHAILANYGPEEAREQISRAQQEIFEMTGKTPVIISYPSGIHSAQVIRAAGESGLQLGVTVKPQKNYLPIIPGSERSMALGRFILNGQRDIKKQSRVFRSDYSLYLGLRNLLRKGNLC